MAIALYMSVHVPLAILPQLRRRGVEVLRAHEKGASELLDSDLLHRATELGIALFTQDIRFRVLAEQWIQNGKSFAGLIYAHQRNSIGTLVNDLEMMAKATDAEEWRNQVAHLPL